MIPSIIASRGRKGNLFYVKMNRTFLQQTSLMSLYLQLYNVQPLLKPIISKENRKVHQTGQDLSGCIPESMREKQILEQIQNSLNKEKEGRREMVIEEATKSIYYNSRLNHNKSSTT